MRIIYITPDSVRVAHYCIHCHAEHSNGRDQYCDDCKPLARWIDAMHLATGLGITALTIFTIAAILSPH
jgi:hypothetical protein